MSNKKIKVTVHVDVMLTGYASDKDTIIQYFKDRKTPIYFDTWSGGKGDSFISLATNKNEQNIISIEELPEPLKDLNQDFDGIFINKEVQGE